MKIFGGSNDAGELILVFDIGSSSIGGALFRQVKSPKSKEPMPPKVLFSVREPLPLENKIDPSKLLDLTTKSLETVANKIFSKGLGAPSKIFCVLSSPWYVSQTRIINFEKNTPFVFTSKLADGLVQKEINLFKEEHLAKYGDIKSGIRLIELKNIKTMLNGYETPKPLNQKAKNLEMTIFISMSPEEILSKIEESINKYFHSKKIQFSSFVIASFTGIRDIYPLQESFLLVDIGGELTDISMIKKGVLNGSVSYPIGFNFIIREVAENLSPSTSEAKSLISLLKDGHASDTVAKKLEAVIHKSKMDWLAKFQESLANISNDISIPPTIYLAVDKDMTMFFREAIEAEQFNQYTLTESKFKIVSLSTEIFDGMIRFGDGVAPDSNLAIEAIYFNRFFV